jgi:hypothetical protein
MEKPKYILLTTVFDDDKLNQRALIPLDNMSKLSIEQHPEILESEIIGSNKKLLIRTHYVITVDYGSGIELDEKEISNDKI